MAESELATIATVDTDDDPAAVARHVAAELTTAGWDCGKVTQLGTGAAFELAVNKRSLLLVIGTDPRVSPGCVLSVGHSMGPISRLLGADEDAERQLVVTALDRALQRLPAAGEVSWFTPTEWE